MSKLNNISSTDISQIIEHLQGMKRGHSSYLCQNKSNNCVCGADEDRWNLALSEAVTYLESLRK